VARHCYTSTAVDATGRVITSASVTIYLAGGTTKATVYAAATGSADADSVITTDSTDGSFTFYVDSSDYSPDQKFKIVISKTNYTSHTHDNISIFPNCALPLDAVEEITSATATLNHWGVSNLNSLATGITATLGSGTQTGQFKYIRMTNASVSSSLSVTKHATSNPEVFVFNATRDSLCLQWTGVNWYTVGNSGATAS